METRILLFGSDGGRPTIQKYASVLFSVSAQHQAAVEGRWCWVEMSKSWRVVVDAMCMNVHYLAADFYNDFWAKGEIGRWAGLGAAGAAHECQEDAFDG